MRTFYQDAVLIDASTPLPTSAAVVTKAPRLRLWIVLALSALALFPGLRRGGLSGYDDALYAHEAKEMTRDGNIWNIQYNGAPNFEYPPLFIWMDAASMKVFGVNDFAAKLPAALAGFGTIVTLYFLVMEMGGDTWLALFSALILSATQPFLKYATHAMTDVPFTFFFTLALLLYAKGLRQPRYLLLSGIPIACALLTRSIIGVTIFGVIGAHMLFTKRYALLWSPFTIGGFALALLPPLAWGMIEYQLHGAAFLHGHLAFISTKVAGGGAWRPSFGVWPYLQELLKYYWPWLPLLVAGLAMQFRMFKRDSMSILAIVWSLCVLVPLTLVQTKYGRYLMPAFPAFAISSAVAVIAWLPRQRLALYFRDACMLFFLALGFTILFPAKERGLDMRQLAPVAERNSEPTERVLLYTYGNSGFDYQNQLLWYADRHAELVTDLRDLDARIAHDRVVAIVDKTAFVEMKKRNLAHAIQILALSEKFVCFRTADRYRIE